MDVNSLKYKKNDWILTKQAPIETADLGNYSLFEWFDIKLKRKKNYSPQICNEVFNYKCNDYFAEFL